MMVAGRAVLGLGGESIIVAATTVLAKWFKGKELSFAFGIKITISRMASVAADNSPTWANKVFYPHGPTGEPSWRGTFIARCRCWSIGSHLLGIYWVLESRAKHCTEPAAGRSPSMTRNSTSRRFSASTASYWFVVGLCLTFYSAIFPFRTFAIDFLTNKILAVHGGTHAPKQCGCWRTSEQDFNSLLPLSAMVATPLMGLLSDRIGKRAFFMMLPPSC